MTRGLVIAATHSGAGKTTVCLGLLAALRRRGLTVQPYKVGPDFIDPGHHDYVSGRKSRNLDGWMLPPAANLAELAAGLAEPADLTLIEGVMGLHDGLDGSSDVGSTAQVAKQLGLPVVLVVDARSLARSAGAVVLGFKGFDPGLNLAGVIFNRVGGAAHLEMLREAVAGLGVEVLGGLPRDQEVSLPERHLGLTTAQERPLTEAALARLAGLTAERLDLDRFLALAGPLPELPPRPRPAVVPRIRLGLALDQAFCFYYQANLDLLAQAGAELVPFSPLAGEIPAGVHGLYLGGGYPELFAARLAAQTDLLAWLREQAQTGLPIYAECGGLMFLGRGLTDLDGRTWPLAGVLPLATTMGRRFQALGYREATLTADCLLGRAGRTIRGHEFHYSHLSGPAEGVSAAYRVQAGRGGPTWAEGYALDRVLGSYVHLHWGSCPEAAQALAAACHGYKEKKR